jgi:hypothetical protein
MTTLGTTLALLMVNCIRSCLGTITCLDEISNFKNLVDLILLGTKVKIQFLFDMTTILGVLPSSHNVAVK